MVNPNDVANKWSRRLSQSTDDIKKGVEGVTVAPSERAVSKKDKFVAELMRAIQEGKWETALRAYGLEEWKKDMINKGISRIASGAENAKSDFAEFMAQFLPYAEEVKKRADSMPDMTLEDRINKAIFVMRELAKFRRK
jgi:hypothetical protein